MVSPSGRAYRSLQCADPNERTNLEVLRTDTATFQELIESRRNRREEWFHLQAGHIDLCNVPIPMRERIWRCSEPIRQLFRNSSSRAETGGKNGFTFRPGISIFAMCRFQ